jgi:hypothetical protein
MSHEHEPQPSPLVTLSGHVQPLREAFNDGAGKTRLLLLVSPT